MSLETGSESGRPGLLVSLKALVATTLAIGKTRAELLVTEIEEEKYRLISLWSKAIAAAFTLALGLVMLVICLAMAFWEHRELVFGLFAGLFIATSLLLIRALRQQFAQPSRLFQASLAELDTDLAQLRGRDGAAR